MILTIGLGLIGVFFLALAFLLDDKHAPIKVLSLVFCILTMLALSSHILNNDNCSIVLTNKNITQISANVTQEDYGYTRECIGGASSSGITIFKLINYFVRIFQIYLFVYLLYWILGLLGLDLLEKIKELGGGKRG